MEDKTKAAGESASSNQPEEWECVTGIRLRKNGETIAFKAGQTVKVRKPYSEQVQAYIDDKVLIPYVEKKSEKDIFVETKPNERFRCLSRIRCDGKLYTRGMAFPSDASEEIIKELKQAGAIEEISND